ncbi:hypothetical protein [Streptomyces beigongshangae]|uniref:hypothetical protein n=1 Tax=Streptomyces beigongshangae TaxID=2841597 RepID=UPI001C85FF6F|nr:hypothetical protein [Streptomyces sp. REN17]
MLTVGGKFPEFVHHVRRKDHPDLTGLTFPMTADPRPELCPCDRTRGEKTLGPVALPAGA